MYDTLSSRTRAALPTPEDGGMRRPRHQEDDCLKKNRMATLCGRHPVLLLAGVGVIAGEQLEVPIPVC